MPLDAKLISTITSISHEACSGFDTPGGQQGAVRNPAEDIPGRTQTVGVCARLRPAETVLTLTLTRCQDPLSTFPTCRAWIKVPASSHRRSARLSWQDP